MAGGDVERVAPRPIPPPCGVDLQFDEARLAQDAEVFGHSRGSEIEFGGQIAGRDPLAGAAAEDGPARCVGERPQQLVDVVHEQNFTSSCDEIATANQAWRPVR